MTERSETDQSTRTPTSPRVLDRCGVLSVMGYKGEVKEFEQLKLLPDEPENCFKCGKKVYPVERIDIGVLYHKSCFKCRVCNVQLSLQNFQRSVDSQTRTKEVFCNTHVPKQSSGLSDINALRIRGDMAAQRAANIRGEHAGVGDYGGDALEFQRLKRDKPGRRRDDNDEKRSRKVRRSSTLRSFDDFERYGVFDAQVALEAIQKQEEDELYQQMASERRRQRANLEKFVTSEKMKTVEELLYWFGKRGTSQEDMDEGLEKVEYYYGRQLQERIKLLERRTGAEEQAAVARMIEKHSQEMIALIADKESMAERDMARHQHKLRSQLDAHDVAAAKIAGNVADKRSQLREHLDTKIQQQQGHSKGQGRRKGEGRRQGHGDASDDSGSSRSDVGSRDDVATGDDDDDADDLRAAFGAPLRSSTFKQHQQQQPGGGAAVQEEEDERSAQVFNQVEAVTSVGEASLSRVAHEPPSAQHRNWQNANQVEDFGGDEQRFFPPNKGNFTVPSLTSANDGAGSGAGDVVTTPERGFMPAFARLSLEGRGGGGDVSADYSSDWSQSEDDDDDNGGSYSLEDIEAVSNDDVTGVDRPEPQRDERGRAFVQLESADRKPAEKANANAKAAKTIVIEAANEKRAPAAAEDKEESAAQRRRRERRQQRKPVIDEIMKPPPDPEEERDKSERLLQYATVSKPKIVPPRESRAQLYSDPGVFSDLDRHAIQEAQKDHRSYTQLVRDLSINCTRELQKVRAIFIWVTAKDLNTMQFEDELEPDSPLGLLRGIKHGAESYHDLFKRLCSYAGLHCVIIDGHSKGSGYRPGSSFKHGAYRNQWTAVWVERGWRFINCNWGARHVKGPRDDTMTYKVDEFYFLTDPHEHVYQHFPRDPRWQLLTSPISMDEFVRLPLVKSPFFNNRLAFARDYSSVVTVKDSFIELQLVCPRLYNFAARLVSKDRTKHAQHDAVTSRDGDAALDAELSSSALQERVLVRMVENDMVALVNLPRVGRYYLDVYVAPSYDSASMEQACGFMLDCVSVARTSARVMYPQLGALGRLPYFQRMTLSEQTHVDSYVTVAADASGDLVLTLTSSRHGVRLTHALQRYSTTSREFADCERYAFPKHRGVDVTSFVVRCPRRGLYVMTLSAEDANERSPSRHAVYRYLIDWRRAPAADGSVTCCFPRASKRWQHCKLVTPLTGDLPVNADVTFRVESSVARGVVVVIDDEWQYLERHDTVWEGVVETGPHPGKAMVYARIDETRDKYIPCLEYQIVGAGR